MHSKNQSLLIMLSIWLVGCYQGTQATVTAVPLPLAQLTEGQQNTSGGTQATLLPSSTATPPQLPNYEQLQIDSNFIFEGQSPDCELPCWYGLVTGKSRSQDIARVFDDVFELSGRDIFIHDQFPTGFPGLTSARLRWQGNASRAGFNVSVYVNKDTRLEGLLFGWGSTSFSPNEFSAASVLRELGQPDTFVISTFESGEAEDFVGLETVLIYDRGVTVRIQYGLKIATSSTGSLKSFEYCFENNDYTAVNFYLTYPFGKISTDLDPIQTEIVTNSVSDPNYQSFQEVFNQSLDGVVQQIQDNQHVCLSAEFAER